MSIQKLSAIWIPYEVVDSIIKSKNGSIVVSDEVESIDLSEYKVKRLPRKKKKNFSNNVYKVLTSKDGRNNN